MDNGLIGDLLVLQVQGRLLSIPRPSQCAVMDGPLHDYVDIIL
jgi:hypothetical protein